MHLVLLFDGLGEVSRELRVALQVCLAFLGARSGAEARSSNGDALVQQKPLFVSTPLTLARRHRLFFYRARVSLSHNDRVLRAHARERRRERLGRRLLHELRRHGLLARRQRRLLRTGT